jgi:hypothetical protein
MATSKSAKRNWTAGAWLYSGRRDPVWTAPARVVRQAMEIWEAAPRATAGPPEAPPLGFRGCFLRDPAAREWHAFAGFITLRGGRGTETRLDPGREFQKLLLDSAPAGLLPPGAGAAP